MSKNKQGLNAEIDKKYLYKKYTVDKLASHFSIAKAEMYETVDFEEEVMEFPLLNEFDFNYVIYSAHIDRGKLNLDWLMDDLLFRKSTLIDEFLIGENTLDSRSVDNYQFWIHIGGMMLIMYRAESVDTPAGIFIDDKQEGGLVLTKAPLWLNTYYPKYIE